MLTWSLGWAGSPARLAITSLAFMFDEVPGAGLEDVDRELIVVLALGDASPAAAIRSARSESSWPSSALTRAAAALRRPSQRMTGTGTGWPGHGEVLDRLGRLRAPELGLRLGEAASCNFQAIQSQPVARSAAQRLPCP